MSFEFIKSYKDSGIGEILLDRPKVLNSLNSQMLREMSFQLEEWATDAEVGVVVFGSTSSKSFAAGADLEELKDLSPLEVVNDYPMAALYGQIEQFSKPTIAAVDGLALGGGFELALACDIRIASEKAKFGFPELGLGILPGAGGTQRLKQAVGRSMALYSVLSGQKIDGTRAYTVGLVAELSEEPFNRAIELAKRISANGPIAQYLAMTAIKGSGQVGHHVEQLSQALAFSTRDSAHGIQSFLNKERPQFSQSPLKEGSQ